MGGVNSFNLVILLLVPESITQMYHNIAESQTLTVQNNPHNSHFIFRLSVRKLKFSLMWFTKWLCLQCDDNCDFTFCFTTNEVKIFGGLPTLTLPFINKAFSYSPSLLAHSVESQQRSG